MKNNSFVKIVVKDMVIDMRIGMHDHEKENARKQRVFINVELFAAAENYLSDICYKNIIDYDHIYSAVNKWAEREHTDFIETYIKELLDLCFEDERVEAANVSITKPDIFKEAERVGVEVYMTRDDWGA